MERIGLEPPRIYPVPEYRQALAESLALIERCLTGD